MNPVAHIIIKYVIVIAAFYDVCKIYQLFACVIKILLNSYVVNFVLLKFST